MTEQEYLATITTRELADEFMKKNRCDFCIYGDDMKNCTGKKCIDGLTAFFGKEHDQSKEELISNCIDELIAWHRGEGNYKHSLLVNEIIKFLKEYKEIIEEIEE